MAQRQKSKEGSLSRIIIYCDGAARGNPGPAGIGAVLTDERGRELARVQEYIGRATNNQAEYKALIRALRRAAAWDAQDVEIRADSELLVRQLREEYRVRNPALRKLWQEVKNLLRPYRAVRIVHVPRHENYLPDTLANAAIDNRQKHITTRGTREAKFPSPKRQSGQEV
ncbi:MAG: ribonuclease HI family protein [Chloroflexi bacterium]|nr:ribonuclease HI family protein [Chloroflexota bacterium]